MSINNVDSRRLARLYNERILWLMRYKQFGRKCKFVYPPKKSHCNNCIVSSSGLSTGKYRPGGSQFFEGTACPVCKGKGILEESVVEEGTMIVLFDHQHWFEPGKASMLPDNSAMAIGDRLKTWDMVVRCERVILNTDVYGDGTPYKLFGEPYPVGLYNGDDTSKSGSRFFYCYFAREAGKQFNTRGE